MVSNYGVDGVNSFLSYGGHFYKLTVFVGRQLWLAGKCVSVGRGVDDLVGSMNHVLLLHNFGYGFGLWKILHTVTHMLFPFLGDTYLAVSVMFHGMTKIPYILYRGFPWWAVIHNGMEVNSGF